MKYRVDASDWSAVGLCREPECAFRAVRFDRLGALKALAEHEAIEHPEDRKCRDNLARKMTPKK